MPDLLIRNVDEGDIRAIDRQAARLGLSRSEFLRQETRKIARHAAAASAGPLTREDLRQSMDLVKDVFDDEVMSKAWG
ncbi:ribbon-helix-helix protein, CopG family [Corynebacterium nuruki]|uniref:type II toxin-antitoxin system VapB family antitoxin n=1 Tax=Corynebacterium nuruki TaxID=1032851 RepID=UPI0039BF9CF7